MQQEIPNEKFSLFFWLFDLFFFPTLWYHSLLPKPAAELFWEWQRQSHGGSPESALKNKQKRITLPYESLESTEVFWVILWSLLQWGFKTFKLRATLPAASVRTCWAANHMKFRPTMALSSTRGRTRYEHNLVKHLYKLMQPYNSPATIIVLVRLIKFN